MDKQIQGMLLQTLTVERHTRTDGRGSMVYESPVEVPCYITGNIRMVRDSRGEEVVSSLSVFLTGTEAAKVDLNDTKEGYKHRITLPNGSQPPVLVITPYYDFRGKLNYVEVSL